MPKACCKCGRPVDWDEIVNNCDSILSRVDYYGEASLTENEQVLYRGEVCLDCFMSGKLD